ncbi:sigma-70 family RNA polymerase sigma factor [uncultured Paludibaculum sp.]|uniref:RNA polymerase sigma factor n=1 Tax=uncultured Paludibaculum sp. TaxID=1765020 RepID=UPI002AAB36C9|nr:sigma-70 family RNA polymerase sigma factor [uncultured Paludibaculum sp.]
MAAIPGHAWRSEAREDAGFAAIVRTHQRMVYSICWHFFRNRAIAEEIGQDVFLQLYRNLDSIDSPEHMESWLRQTATHRCIDNYRKKSNRQEISMEGLAEPASLPQVKDTMMSEHLQRLVASLPETQRAVVILRYQEDLDVHEIAATLQMPERTVWSHLRRAIGVLQEKAARRLGQGRMEKER